MRMSHGPFCVAHILPSALFYTVRGYVLRGTLPIMTADWTMACTETFPDIRGAHLNLLILRFSCFIPGKEGKGLRRKGLGVSSLHQSGSRRSEHCVSDSRQTVSSICPLHRRSTYADQFPRMLLSSVVFTKSIDKKTKLYALLCPSSEFWLDRIGECVYNNIRFEGSDISDDSIAKIKCIWV